MELKIIDNFYKKENFEYMLTSAMLNAYHSYHHPQDSSIIDRKKAYPCYQTNIFSENDLNYQIFLNSFQEKTGLVIDKVKTMYRKIYSNELEHIFKYGQQPHRDKEEFDIAGVVYFNNIGLDNGTGIFSNVQLNEFQIEPDVIVGAKPNRCVYYSTDIWHKPLQDKDTELRIIQPFFIKIKKI